MRGYVITGAARGLGLALAQAVIAQGGHLIALARNESAELRALAEQGRGYRFVACDLSDMHALPDLADEVFGSLASIAWESLTLINNAGVIDPIGPSGTLDDAAIVRLVQINVTAPMLLTNAFIRHLGPHRFDRRIMNISSGAGRRPSEGWSTYCASKAALDMFTLTAAQEQASHDGIGMVSIAPGIIDTGMQSQIRQSTTDQFPNLEYFINMKETGQLTSPEVCAEKLIAYLHDARFGQDAIADIRAPFPGGSA
ncbi:SDR family NAD(P)-dependent oxidoreductase [Burkholderiaceae bacterium DAT-1]|nr:SDR family NAD(P)-dependent oxidoreductase [Burkholderiaceae bacterium DAT-1]